MKVTLKDGATVHSTGSPTVIRVFGKKCAPTVLSGTWCIYLSDLSLVYIEVEQRRNRPRGFKRNREVVLPFTLPPLQPYVSLS